MTSEETAALSIHVAEYGSLRTEINAFHATEAQIMNFSIALLGALIGYMAKGTPDEFVLLYAPLPFFLLGAFFGYTQIRIIQVAAYLSNNLRSRAVSILGRKDIWRWEYFRRNKDIDKTNRNATSCPVILMSTWLSWLRWLLFLWPVALPLLVLHKGSVKGWQPWVPAVTTWVAFLFLAWFAIYCAKWLPDKVLRLEEAEN